MFKKKTKEPEMSLEDKLQQLIDERVTPKMAIHISNAIVSGRKIAFSSLYKEYVQPHDLTKDPVEKARIVEKLLSKIRLEHLRSLQEQEGKDNA